MKNINFENLEVLSPAGNPKSFMTALNSGADAIYLGLDSFNARMRAENFTKDNICEFIKLAHSYSIKVYITINTLLNDEDFDELVSLVDFLTKAKADAFIVQDLGVAYVLRKCFKGIILHASTQMGIHNLEGALVAEKLGFSRIVLSRETTIEDIKEISQNTNLEIEYFVQGALCVAFSGNCYLSSIENNASGNEGKCLQLCRLCYQNNKTNKEKYYLSTRDLSLLENLPKLIEAGITSFKIEGRLKHEGYVAICTKLYKTALNLIKNDNFNNKFLKQANEDLRITFSRGEFNKSAYLFKNTENNIINSSFQNHIGLKIGKVEKVTPFKNNLFKIQIFSSKLISNGDGLKFIDNKNNQVASLGVGNPITISKNQFEFITKHKLKKGLDVYLIQDAKLESKYLNEKKKIPIILNISATQNLPLLITATANNISATFQSAEILLPAKSKPLTELDFLTQFSKTNDSIFLIKDIFVQTNGVFAPKSILNEARRNILKIMQKNIIYHNEKKLNAEFLIDKYEKIKTQKIKISPNNLVIINENMQFNDNLINIISPNNYCNFNANLLEKSKLKNIALFLPVITNFEDKKIINKIIKTLPKETLLFVNNIGGLYHKIYNNKNIIVSPLLNIKNKFAIMQLNELGINQICASIESNIEFANNHSLSIFEYGNFPLMTFAHCPYIANFENNCSSCKCDDKLTYTSQSKQTYKIKKSKISKCYFYLMKNISNKNCKYYLKNLKND